MSRATSALNADRAQEALRVLAMHRREFPHGVLTEERRAATAQALCLLARFQEAQTAMKELAPGSPAAGRAKQVCDKAAQKLEAK